MKEFNVSVDDTCPYCGSKDLLYDLVVDDDDTYHNIVDCEKCGRRLYYEDY